MRTTFSRNSVGWMRAADGRLTSADIDTPRREFDADGRMIGVLIEEQSTIQNSHPDEINASSYDKSSISVSANAGEAPDGSQTADKITPTGSGSHYFRETLTTSSNERYLSVSAFVKRVGLAGVRINKYGGSSKVFFDEIDINAYFDLRTGEVSSKDSATLAFIEPYADGWFRVGAAKKTSSVSTLVGIGMAFLDADGNYYYPAQGDDGMLCWGWQRETGLWSSRIPSSTSQATRAADFSDAPGANNEYGPGLHTWKCAVRMSRDPGEPTVLGYTDGRIYAKNRRLHLDGPGTLWQPDGEHAPGDYVPFYWTTQFAGASPDFSLGRGIGDTDWWNGHLVDIVPYPRTIRESEIRRELGL